MNSEGQPIGSGSDSCSIPDLRGLSLAQLAEQAGQVNSEVADVVARLTDSLDSPRRVQATMFNSAI